MADDPNVCPACGYAGLDDPPWRGASPSDEICPCCGLHFGYDDDVGGRSELRPVFYHGWRLKWRTDGMRWSSPTPPPDGWDAEAQFRSLRYPRLTQAEY